MVLNQSKSWPFLFLALAMLFLMARPASAQLTQPEGDEYSVNDFGGIGLMQTRTARFAPDGQLNIGASFVNPYRRYFITWQVLPSVEVSFRYTDVQNVRFGSGAFDLSQDQFFSDLINLRNGGTNLDRGFDIKIKLLSEGKFTPALAVGLQDFIGTGLFSGEYLVASKSFGQVDVSLGLGWGEVGNRAHFNNPFSIFGEKYKTRTGRSDLGGLVLFNRLFTGPEVALFGGVEYFTDIEGLSIKLEYNGTNQSKLARLDTGKEFINDKTPFAVGINYRTASWFDFSVAWERGEALMIRGSFRANLHRKGIEKPQSPEPMILQREEIELIERESALIRLEEVGVVSNGSLDGQVHSQTTLIYPEDMRPTYSLDETNFEQAKETFPIIKRELIKVGYWPSGLRLADGRATIYLSNSLYKQVPNNAGYVSRIVANHLPSNIEKITVVEMIADFEISRVTVLRSDIEREARYMSSAEEIWFNVEVETPQSNELDPQLDVIEPRTYPSKSWWIAPELKQHIGSPSEGIYLADIDVEAGFVYNPIAGLKFIVVGRRYIAGELDNLASTPNSRLPHVRTDLVKYLQGGRTSIKTMQIDYVGSFKPNWYYRIAAGLFEPMYGGVGTEVLYRPYGKPWALSVELDWVKKREFNQLFSFRNYNIVTGHATLNYDLPMYGLRTTISAGRYLAGDHGMTFEVSRRFDNGVRVGAFFTRTNVSAADFGEGSFDKGFYIKFPFDVFLRGHSKQEANFVFKPLTRDGGQKVGVGPSLFELVDRANYSVLNREWSTIGR